jgi:hypothetical protein
MKTKKPSYAQLQRQVLELTAGLSAVHKCALLGLKKASTATRTGSGVVLHLSAVGGASIVDPVMIRDGLSPDTLEALARDIQRSLDLTKSGV